MASMPGGYYTYGYNQQPQYYQTPSLYYHPSSQPLSQPQAQTQQQVQPNQYPASPSQSSSSQSPEEKQPVAWLCLYADCPSFARKADLQRHMDIVHNRDSLQLHDCVYPGCKRYGTLGFTRKDKMVEHMRVVHNVDIPKRPNGKRQP